MRKVEAFWFEKEDEDGEDISSYHWDCPNCQEMNFIGDDFVWSGKEGKHCTKMGYACEHCDSEEEFIIYRD